MQIKSFLFTHRFKEARLGLETSCSCSCCKFTTQYLAGKPVDRSDKPRLTTDHWPFTWLRYLWTRAASNQRFNNWNPDFNSSRSRSFANRIHHRRRHHPLKPIECESYWWVESSRVDDSFLLFFSANSLSRLFTSSIESIAANNKSFSSFSHFNNDSEEQQLTI